jgi:hypothetical protein
MNDLATVEIGQSVQDTFSDLAENLLSSATSKLFDFFVNAVETTTFAELHGNGDCTGRLVHESTIVATDVVGGAIFVEVELTNNLFLDVGVGVCSNDLDRCVSLAGRILDSPKRTYL